MGYANVNNPANYQLAMLGQFGFRIKTNTSTPVAGEYYRILEVVSDNATITATSAVGGDNLSANSFTNGTKIYGLFSSVSVSAGEVIAYIA
jgi:hypothetical protein